MNKKKYFLGIDTSCYTTSCAIVDEEGQLIGEERKLLEVKAGQRGLAQSNMVFQHTRALPDLIGKLPQVPIEAIGVSAFPRREENSYMPAFLVGRGTAHSLSHLLQCKVYEFSHQENHILAAIRSHHHIFNEPFMSLHLSGGTTELLLCHPKDELFFASDLIGGTSDLNSGQFIDRLGVALGLPFPAGPHVERLALAGTVEKAFPISCKEGLLSFSGPYSEGVRRLEKGHFIKENFCAEMIDTVAKSVVQFLQYHLHREHVKTLIAVGGVMSNGIIRKEVETFCTNKGVMILFAEPTYSSDNGTGVAYGASLLHK